MAAQSIELSYSPARQLYLMPNHPQPPLQAIVVKVFFWGSVEKQTRSKGD